MFSKLYRCTCESTNTALRKEFVVIYFDNSATTLIKPDSVSAAMVNGIKTLGNAGRSFYSPALDAARQILNTRQKIAQLVQLNNPLHVAFTSCATESLNLVTQGLVKPGDVVVTSPMEHNSVLRPLARANCSLLFLEVDEKGTILPESLYELAPQRPKYLFCTHGSNVTGTITDVNKLHAICKELEMTFVLDVSQTLGTIKVTADMADILCFTGHKGLFGPQGTGGIIVSKLPQELKITKTGGTGSLTFSPLQPRQMPDIFEAGTLNSHGIYPLGKGVEFLLSLGIEKIEEKEQQLVKHFVEKARNITKITLYGEQTHPKLPVVSFNIVGFDSEEVAEYLWEKGQVCCRAGFHCAPLLHQFFGTQEQGMVRFSFSYFNTLEEIDFAISLLKDFIAAHE